MAHVDGRRYVEGRGRVDLIDYGVIYLLLRSQ